MFKKNKRGGSCIKPAFHLIGFFEARDGTPSGTIFNAVLLEMKIT